LLFRSAFSSSPTFSASIFACRAAVYGALVPASQFVPNGGTDAQKKSLGRANAANSTMRPYRLEDLMRHLPVVIALLTNLVVASPAAAQGWGRGWFEKWSGPGPFNGTDVRLTAGCVLCRRMAARETLRSVIKVFNARMR